MNLKLLLITLFLIGYSFQLMAQSLNDRTQVLQKCLDLHELQAHYPLDGNGTLQKLYIMQHGVSFDENIKVFKGETAAAFMTKDEINHNGIEAYFLFHDFTIVENTSKVAFVYQRKDNNNDLILNVVNLDFKKTGNTWALANSKIEIR